MKEILEAFGARIRSPLFGYYILTAVVINWKAFFNLFFSHATTKERISYFESITDLDTLILYPLYIAVFAAIAYPWLNYVFLMICKKPTDLRNAIQAQSEHNLLIKKQELEAARSQLLSSAETELYDRAKRDEKLSEIEDKDIREKLQAEINQLRKEQDEIKRATEESLSSSVSNNSKQYVLDEDQINILHTITDHGGDMQEKDIIEASKFDKVKIEYYLDELENGGYLSKDFEGMPISDYVYSLTTISKKLMIDLGFVK